MKSYVKPRGDTGRFHYLENAPVYTFYSARPWFPLPPSLLLRVKARQHCHGPAEPFIKEYVRAAGDGRQVRRKSPVATFRERLCNWCSAVGGILQLPAGKLQVVVNHSAAAVYVISARELGRDVGTCSHPQESHRAISDARHFMLRCRGLGPSAHESAGVRATFVRMLGPTEGRFQGSDFLGEQSLQHSGGVRIYL